MKLEPAEAEVLAADAAAFARAIPDPSARPRFEQLAAAAAEGEVPDELVPAVEAMLELLFDRGRGRQQSIAAREVNKALRALRGQRVENLRVTAGPSRHTLVLETDRCKLTLELDSAGARVASLETG